MLWINTNKSLHYFTLNDNLRGYKQMNKISRTKQEKSNLVEHILDKGGVVKEFKPIMRKTLLKLSHNDISNLALGFVVYKEIKTNE